MLYIGGGNRGARGPWPPLNLRPLHRNVIFAIENHLSLAKWPPLLSVASSASDAIYISSWSLVSIVMVLHRILLCSVTHYTDTLKAAIYSDVLLSRILSKVANFPTSVLVMYILWPKINFISLFMYWLTCTISSHSGKQHSLGILLNFTSHFPFWFRYCWALRCPSWTAKKTSVVTSHHLVNPWLCDWAVYLT